MSKKTRPVNPLHCLIAITISTFIIIVLILLFLLPGDHCNCPSNRTEYIIEKQVLTASTKTFDSAHNLAVLVPFRERFDELLVFVPYMRKFLHDQHINHHIFVINQVDSYRFNRASLINIGYLYTKTDYDYVAMHDIDLLPLNKNLSYGYPHEQPFHVAAPNLHPRYHYANFVGGILLINRDHFKLVNGMSNKYWGWGLEDDEFFVRLRDAKLGVTRPTNIATGINDTFKHIHPAHRKRDTAKCFNQRDVTRRRDRQTGLHDVNYRLIGVSSLTIDGEPVTIINVELICDRAVTPWCDCSAKAGNKNKT